MTPRRIVFHCTLAALCAAAPSLAASVLRDQSPPVRHWLHYVGGTYLGNVVDAGRMVRQTVRITRDAQDQIVGTYTVQHDEEVVYEGRLINAKIQGPRSILFTWKDRHGEGVIRMDFAEDGESFKGCWGVEQLNPAQTTAGRRRGTE